MRLQFICFVVLQFLFLFEGAPNEAVNVEVKRSSFFQWLAMILRPTTVKPQTTSAPVTEPTSIEMTCNRCRCGLINTVRRIVGGQETHRHQYPWMVVILLFGHFYCAGSLISDLYVLTAAHCLHGVPTEIITVNFLEHNRSHSDPQLLIQRRAIRVNIHELYNPRSFENDIALIRLDQPLELRGILRPICLPAYNLCFTGELGIVTGWGAKREGGYATDVLQEVDVRILSQNECRNSSYRPDMITNSMLCAGYLGVGAKDACSGDSGGPLHVLSEKQSEQYQLAGIVSWGTGCGRPDSPGVYTRVNQYLRWIETHTSDACYCMED